MLNKILIAEDDEDIVEILKLYLESSNYKVLSANDGKKALDIIENEEIDLAILDIMMPIIDGLTLIKLIRNKYKFPILLLTARTSDIDKINGLNRGADDYLTKPFNPLEVLARVNALLRRYNNLNKEQDEEIIIFKELKLNTKELKLYKNNKEIFLTPIEYKIIVLLLKNINRVYTKIQIANAVSSDYYDSYDNSIMVHISHLREKIEDDPKNPKYIINVRGLGYKIEKE